MAGKGDRYRKVDQNKFGENYDRIFSALKAKKHEDNQKRNPEEDSHQPTQHKA